MYVNKEVDVDVELCYDDFEIDDVKELVEDWCEYGGHLDLIKSIVEKHTSLDEEEKGLNLDFLNYPNKSYAKEVFERNEDYLKLIKFIKENY